MNLRQNNRLQIHLHQYNITNRPKYYYFLLDLDENFLWGNSWYDVCFFSREIPTAGVPIKELMKSQYPGVVAPCVDPTCQGGVTLDFARIKEMCRNPEGFYFHNKKKFREETNFKSDESCFSSNLNGSKNFQKCPFQDYSGKGKTHRYKSGTVNTNNKAIELSAVTDKYLATQSNGFVPIGSVVACTQLHNIKSSRGQVVWMLRNLAIAVTKVSTITNTNLKEENFVLNCRLDIRDYYFEGGTMKGAPKWLEKHIVN